MFTKFKIEIILGFILVLFISGLLFLIKSTHQENTALKTETIAQQLKLSENEASFNTLIKTEDIANKVTEKTVADIAKTQREVTARIQKVHQRVSDIKSRPPSDGDAQLKINSKIETEIISQVRIEAIYAAYCSATQDTQCDAATENPAS